MPKFELIDQFISYVTLKDKTNTDPRYLVEGSQNVLIDEKGRIAIRNGYTIYGAASSAINAVESNYDWKTSTGTELNLRAYDDELEFYDSNKSAWTRLASAFAAVDFSFDTWWDNSEGIDLLLFVNGVDKIWEWSGGTAVLSSATANTLTKTGTATWAEARFLTAGTRQVIINGTTYTYTGGEGTTTLTGVTGDPSAEAANSTVFQAIILNDNQPANNTKNDFIRILNNHLYVGSVSSRVVYISKSANYIDFTYSSPRVTTEGGLLTLDSFVVGFAPQGQQMFISAGKDDWYKADFEVLDVGGIVTELLTAKKLKTGTNQGAKSHDLITNVGNNIMFISNEPALREFGDLENLEGPQLKAISNPIKPDFDAADFTGGHIKSHNLRTYISAPNDDRVFINEIRENERGELTRFWQPPQVMPIRRFADIGGVLYGHSNRVPESYKLFNGTNDEDISFDAKAIMAYRNYGTKENYKNLDEWLTEGYISANTKLKLEIRYDYQGYTQILEADIEGDNDDILFQATGTGSLAEQPLGESPLGDNPEESSLLPKFMNIKSFPKADFFEIQVKYSTDTKDAQWQLLSFGGNIRISKSTPIIIKT